MTAFNRRYDDSKYVNGFVYSAADFEFLDINLTKTLNGRGGGTWAPAASIEIGPTGAGVWFAMAVVMGGGIHVWATSGAPLTLDDSDFILRSQTITRVSQALDGIPGPPGAAPLGNRTTGSDWTLVDPTKEWVSGVNEAILNTAPASWLFPLSVIDGSQLTQVTFHFQIPLAHTVIGTAVPDHPIRFAVWQIDQDGARVALLTGTDPDGYVTVAASAYATTAANSQVIAASATIDTSLYHYQCEFLDEYGNLAWSGAGNGNVLFGAKANFATTDYRPQ